MGTEIEFGPAMAALKPRQREFVLAMAADPFGSAAKWARAAGYSDKSGAAKVRAHHLMHSPRIEAAVLEVGRSMLHGVGPVLAAHAILRAAADPTDKYHLRAAEMLANRVGLHEVQEVHVRRTDETLEAKVARIRELAKLLGVDPAGLIGANLTALPVAQEVNRGSSPIIEGELAAVPVERT